MFPDFFGDSREQRRQPGMSSGSGVIISEDGYIVTNNHVIEDADKIEVTLNDNRIFEAKKIGTDPNTDLALIKVEEEGLPHMSYGNSDDVRIGEWVLAVGNPFNLTSTVTAGIVSAKARNINILRRRYGIESFIQTDAAVNPGNSGGALVDLKGRLLGINTAIATPTGTYAGYSFAVPVSIVKKVVEDLKEYGVVQRALLGVEIADVSDPRIQERGVDELSGVYVMSVGEESAADEAGIEEGDVIVAIDNVEVKNVAELQDQVARHRPGDKIEVTFKREGKTKTTNATLKNMMNDTKVVKSANVLSIEGATFTNISEEDKESLEIENGVKITKLGNGKFKAAGIKEGFIITSIDKMEIKDVDDLTQVLRGKRGGILIAGVYPDGEEAYYGLGW
jgi:Do/DeqQ family serine protease